MTPAGLQGDHSAGACILLAAKLNDIRHAELTSVIGEKEQGTLDLLRVTLVTPPQTCRL